MWIIRRYLPRFILAVVITFLMRGLFLNMKKRYGSIELVDPEIDRSLRQVLLYKYNMTTNGAVIKVPTKAATRATATSITSPGCRKQRSVVFIKTHKSGSTTLTATLQKYAYINNLLMMVPRVENNMFDWPLEFSANRANIAAPKGSRFDMLVNHIIFNKTSIAPLVKPDAKYVTILREPLSHLRSSFQYFDINKGDRLGHRQQAIQKYLSNPFRYDRMPSWMDDVVKLAVNRVNSMTRNLQSADLGLLYWHMDNKEVVARFIAKTMKDFQLIFILERIEESLVIFRRMMCWKMEDIIFIRKNVNPVHEFEFKDLSKTSRANAYKWNNVDSQLYNLATQRLDYLVALQPDIKEEIAVFKIIQSQVTRFCLTISQRRGAMDNLIIPSGRWNEQIVVDNKFCVLLLLDERDLTHVFKCNQYPQHKNCQGKSGNRVNSVISMIEGHTEYRNIPMTPRTKKY